MICTTKSTQAWIGWVLFFEVVKVLVDLLLDLVAPFPEALSASMYTW